MTRSRAVSPKFHLRFVSELPVLHFDGQPYVLIDDVKAAIAARKDSEGTEALKQAKAEDMPRQVFEDVGDVPSRRQWRRCR